MTATRRAWVDRRVLAGGLAVVLLIAVAVAYAMWDRDGDAAGAALREYPLGQRPAAPAIAGQTLDGADLDLADLRGEVVVVNVWASWCPPCRAETADLEQVHQATRDSGVRFVGVNIRDGRDRAASFLEGRVTYPSIYDPASRYAVNFGDDPPAPLGPPATLVIDRAGKVAAAIYRAVRRSELSEIVTRVAAEEPAGHG